MDTNTKVALNLSNCIIGVSILAMPYCMKTCGVFLGVMMMTVSCLLTRFTCHLLLKSALVSRRKSFEFLAFHTFGHAGKLAAEINIIGFLLGILISFFVVIGDLTPVIISKVFSVTNSSELRIVVLLFVGFGIALPLAMLKEVDTLVRISTLSVLFYSALALKTIAEALPVLLYDTWKTRLVLWEPSGLLQTLPIFSLALSCQTQLFEVFGALPDASLKQMNAVVKLAAYLSTTLYLTVGVFGYIANANKDFTGNILLSFSPGMSTDVIKLCFVLSVAMSFPLVIFPCRTSIHSLLFRRSTGPFDISCGYIPETRFKIITAAIVVFTLLIGVLCPSIEIVLSFIGSTIGILTCIVFPAVMFIHIVSKHTFERWGSQLVLIVGILLLASCTWENINHNDDSKKHAIKDVGVAIGDTENFLDRNAVDLQKVEVYTPTPKAPKLETNFEMNDDVKPMEVGHVDCRGSSCNVTDTNKRREPPVPQEPEDNVAESNNAKPIDPVLNLVVVAKKSVQEGDVAIITKKLGSTEKSAFEHQEEILKKLEAQQIEQKKLLEEQREILEELKAHERSHNKQDQGETMGNDGNSEKSLKSNGNHEKSERLKIIESKDQSDRKEANFDNEASKDVVDPGKVVIMPREDSIRLSTSGSPRQIRNGLIGIYLSKNEGNVAKMNLPDSNAHDVLIDEGGSKMNQRGEVVDESQVHENMVNGTGHFQEPVGISAVGTSLPGKQGDGLKLVVNDRNADVLKQHSSFPLNNDSAFNPSESRMVASNNNLQPNEETGGELFESKKVGRDLKTDFRKEAANSVSGPEVPKFSAGQLSRKDVNIM